MKSESDCLLLLLAMIGGAGAAAGGVYGVYVLMYVRIVHVICTVMDLSLPAAASVNHSKGFAAKPLNKPIV